VDRGQHNDALDLAACPEFGATDVPLGVITLFKDLVPGKIVARPTANGSIVLGADSADVAAFGGVRRR
jgi:hypothetical protein